MIHIDIPQDVNHILEKLRNEGYEAYAVGGCVRDSLLGKEPKDWDITTSALPDDVKNIFGRTIDTGIKHGTVTVMVSGTGYEVTTYRVDGEYLDGRHPETVEFTASLNEDLKRRDFTINAFVYNENEGIKDLFGGLEDLKNGIIRCVGEAEERFGEDALRILRAIRFAAQLSFSIEPETYKAAIKLAGNLRKVSAERIKTELEKTLLSDNPDHICLLKDMGIDRVILEEFEKIENIEGLKAALRNSPKNPAIRWAILCFFIESQKAGSNDIGSVSKDILQRLKFDNKTMDRVLLFLKTTVRFKDTGKLGEEEYRIYCRRLLREIGEEDIFLYLDFCSALINGLKASGGESCTMCIGIPERKESGNNIGNQAVSEIKPEIIDILEKKECYSLKNLAVNGRDIIKVNNLKGKEIGDVLEALLETVIVSPEKNTRECLLEVAKAYGHK